MKPTPTLALAAIILGALLVTGCSNAPSGTHALYRENNQGVNLAGLVDVSPAGYNEINPDAVTVHTDELMKRKNITGNNISFFWGAVVLADY